jgi:hypothetical protein
MKHRDIIDKYWEDRGYGEGWLHCGTFCAAIALLAMIFSILTS